MAYKEFVPLITNSGGTNAITFNAYEVLCTDFNDFLQVSGTGSLSQVLTSQGAGTLPIWTDLANETFFEPLASDPAMPMLGQVWFNTGSNLFKGAVSGGAPGSWTIKANMNTARAYLGGSGDTDDALSFGGNTPGASDVTERYNLAGNSWTAKSSMPTTHGGFTAGCGSAADALNFGGSTPGDATYRYDGGGDSWSTKANLPASTSGISAGGTAADAMGIGGTSTMVTNVTQRYDGGADSWTLKANLNTARGRGSTSGSDAATALFGCGETSGAGASTNVEQYDGGSNVWSNKASYPLSRSEISGSGIGSMAILANGRSAGIPLNTQSSYQYDGGANSWSALANTNNSFRGGAGGGPGATDLAIIFGGDNGGGFNALNITEILGGGSGITIVTFTVI